MKHAPPYGFNIGEAITPLDGRNRYKLLGLSEKFSDFVLNRNRVRIELLYLQKLSAFGAIRRLNANEKKQIVRLIESFDFKEYIGIRKIEKTTNHEAKAVEEYLKAKLRKTSLKDVCEMVHFGLTSDDVNNLAYAIMLDSCLKDVIFPELDKIQISIKRNAEAYKNTAMLSRTHGQPAAPTTLGKEFSVYYKRLHDEIGILKKSRIRGKLTGNTGNLNPHKLIFPGINWPKFSTEFVSELSLEPDIATTQIEPYDSIIRLFQGIFRINNILIGLSVDFWLYITLGYFRQKLIKKEVGSTALPHKINPIYFEGAEGGFGVANALIEFYSRKLPYSRLQRDLSDSTVRRSFGIALGYSLLSYQSISEAIGRIEANGEAIRKDLDSHYEVLSEAFQNYLRVRGYENAYDRTKDFFRGRTLTREEIDKFIDGLEISASDKNVLKGISPENYTGYAGDLTVKAIK